jgi:flagella basal body P-ring formation protein FlgA
MISSAIFWEWMPKRFGQVVLSTICMVALTAGGGWTGEPVSIPHQNNSPVKSGNSLTGNPAKIEAELLHAVYQYITYHMPWNPETATITKLSVSGADDLATGKLTYRIATPRHTDFLGNVALAVHLDLDGKPYRKLWAKAYVKVVAPVVVTQKALGRFEIIKPGDVQLVAMDLTRVPSNAARKLDQVVGRRTTRSIYPQSVVCVEHTEIPPAVFKGDYVTIVAENKTLKITAPGITQEKGRPGERIKVVNVQSKKTVYALVVDSSTVKVEF